MTNTPAKFDLQDLEARKNKLAEVAATLKSEFFGNDEVIDLVMSTISAWYIVPELIIRPVIVNLWGLTGVGKTQMVRRLTQLLEFADRFVEVQMDGISSGGGCSTIEGLLASSSIEECVPGILLLDEIQRYRTVDEQGSAVKIERYQDVWMLLSDGKFAANSSTFRELEMMLAYQAWVDEGDRIAASEKKKDEVKKADDTSESPSPEKRRMLYPYEARRFKKLLRMTESIHEIMKMSATELMILVNQMAENKQNNQLDYSKLLIFISGNLDEAYSMAEDASNCDTDADVFHVMSKNISVMDIKAALGRRFRPEQISRFGNNHIIYPSLSRKSYQQLIESICNQYIKSMSGITGLAITLSEDSREVIYQNSVYPAQGTRPVFSSVHKIFSDGLVSVAFRAIQNKANKIDLVIEPGLEPKMVGTDDQGRQYSCPLQLDVHSRKDRATEDFRAMVAVHEAGHALVYALLHHKAPADLKINTASYTGGYMTPLVTKDVEAWSAVDELNNISVSFAGRCAEALVFGPDRVSMGAASDLSKATKSASYYLRRQGLGKTLGVEVTPAQAHIPDGIIPDVQLNQEVNALLQKQSDLADKLLRENQHLLIRLVSALLEDKPLKGEDFAQLLPELSLTGSSNGYAKIWNDFQEANGQIPSPSASGFATKPNGGHLHVLNNKQEDL